MKNNYRRTLAYFILLQLSFQILCQTPIPEAVVVGPTIVDPTQIKPSIIQNPAQPQVINPIQIKPSIPEKPGQSQIKPTTPQKPVQAQAKNLHQIQPSILQKALQPQITNPASNPTSNPTVNSIPDPTSNPSAEIKQMPQNPPPFGPNTENSPQYKTSEFGQSPKETNQPKKYQYVRENENDDEKDQQYIQDQGQKQSLKQQINSRQTQKVSTLLRQQHFDSTKNYDFQLIDTADFYVKSSIEHKYITVARSYSFIDGNYKVPDKIQDLNPIRIQVYDEKGRKITSQEFSFLGGISFDMVPGVSYQISFSNVKNQRGRVSAKLMSVSWKNYAEHEKLSDKMVSDNNQLFSKAALRMRQQAQTVFGNLHQLWLFDNQAQHSLNTNTMKLFYWSIFQILATILAAAIQVQIIRRLLRPASIVI